MKIIQRQILIVLTQQLEQLWAPAHIFLDYLLSHLGKIMVPSYPCGTLIMVTKISILEEPLRDRKVNQWRNIKENLSTISENSCMDTV